MRQKVVRNIESADAVHIEIWASDLDGTTEWIEICPQPISQRSVVDVVKDLQHRLGMPLTSVLTSVGIAYRTFHTWEEDPAIAPRTASVGRLWDLATAVDDFERHVDNLKIWLAAPSRRATLVRGDFDILLTEAIRSRFPASQRLVPVTYTADETIASELEEPNVLRLPNDIRRANRVR
jgi:hypothetical protein